MNWIFSARSDEPVDVARIGGKGASLTQLYRSGFAVPEPVCLTTDAYGYFVGRGGLRERIYMELHRKPLAELRWEEIWDAALRIKSLFRKTPMPGELARELLDGVYRMVSNRPLVIRSSAPEEDAGRSSFAGLHESYVNISGDAEILEAVKGVWASLWSDRALLYRQELRLDVGSSAMAVVIQEFLAGEASGIVFGTNPTGPDEIVIEAVYGLNAGLVDGTVEPDRWFIDRIDDAKFRHVAPPGGRFQLIATEDGLLEPQPVPHPAADTPPLDDRLRLAVADLSRTLERRFETARDIEWTVAGGRLYLLQARPITASAAPGDADGRTWYLGLHRSYHALLDLRDRIEHTVLPEMDRDAERFAAVALETLSDRDLAGELERRQQAGEHWTAVYWSDCIPFAHGVRLFGDYYNSLMQPDDPFEFVSLLSGESLLTTKRNEILHECGRMYREDADLRRRLQAGDLEGLDNPVFRTHIDTLRNRFGLAPPERNLATLTPNLLLVLLEQYSRIDRPKHIGTQHRRRLEQDFCDRAGRRLPIDPKELLDLARASYRLRDDDNIHIGAITFQFDRACAAARKRLQERYPGAAATASAAELVAALRGARLSASIAAPKPLPSATPRRSLQARQLIGQPASPGVGSGRARVINRPADLQAFEPGEILVTDAVDPTMTFFAPLAAGIVERRGGMLIHGAIIAREYGIPCVTGISEATGLIATGDRLVVDGYLGLVTRESSTSRPQDP